MWVCGVQMGGRGSATGVLFRVGRMTRAIGMTLMSHLHRTVSLSLRDGQPLKNNLAKTSFSSISQASSPVGWTTSSLWVSPGYPLQS